MINQNEVNNALAAADKPIMVETARQLLEAVDDWLECDVIGIDTEFVRERTWRADLGVIQLSNGLEVMGSGAGIFTAVIWVIALFLFFYARAMSKRGVLS